MVSNSDVWWYVMVYFMRTTSLDLLVNQDPWEIVQISMGSRFGWKEIVVELRIIFFPLPMVYHGF